MSDMDEAAKAPDSKRWQCGDPYQYRIPETGDHWANLLAPLMERDKAQCEIWKDEVQNLLIFAGLFSGVLSAFLIQSIQSLQPDPNDIKIALLAHIATRLDNPLNGTASVFKPIDTLLSPTPPAASSIRINIFWFIGLVLSLTTVLMGIISMQWLREHQQYPKSLSSKQTFALFNMRAEGLEAWYVPQIFSALPLLLQSALILFLVGMVDFLLVFGIKIAIPVIIVMGIPLVFLIWTTVMPAFQAFIFCLRLGLRTYQVPQQCPYKSPQSKIVRYIVTFSRRAFPLYARLIIAAHSAAIVFPLRLVRLLKNDAVRSEQLDTSIDEDALSVFEYIFSMWNNKTWLSFDDNWLVIRNAYASGISHPSTIGKHWAEFDYHIRCSKKNVGPLYDLTRGLSSAVAENENSTVQFSGYHCVQELGQCVIGEHSCVDDSDKVIIRLEYNQYLQKLLSSAVLHQELPTFSGLVRMPNLAFLEDENIFIFLSRCRKPPFIVLQHFAELHIRILNYLCLATPNTDILDGHPNYPAHQWLDTYIKRSSVIWPGKEYDAAFDTDISSQFSFVIDAFLKSAADPKNNDKTLVTSSHSQKLADILTFAILRQSEGTIPLTLDFLSANINSYTDGTFGERSDLMFYASAFYARTLMIPNPLLFDCGAEGWHHVAVLEPFLAVLRRYRQERGTPDLAFGERLGIPILSGKWWDFLDHSPEENENCRTEALEIIVTTSHTISSSPSNHDNEVTSSMNPSAEQHLNTGPEEDPLPSTSQDTGHVV